MTISSPDIIAKATGAGSPVVLAVPGQFQSASDIRVYRVETVDGEPVETLLSTPANYTLSSSAVSGQVPQRFTGSITTTANVTAAQTIVVVNWPADDQTSQLHGQPYSASNIERELDRNAIRDAVQSHLFSLGIRLSLDEDGPGPIMQPIAAGKTLMKGTGNTLVEGPDADDIAAAQGYAEQVAADKVQVKIWRDETEDFRDNVATITVDSHAELLALTAPYPHLVKMLGWWYAGDGGGGDFVYNDSDLSSWLLTPTVYTPASVDTGANELVFATWPRILKGYSLYVQTGNADLDAGTIVYASRDVDDFTNIRLHPTFDDALAGTNVIDLTDATVPVLRVHRDPLQGMVAIMGSDALDGSDGGYRRLVNMTGVITPMQFGAFSYSIDTSPDEIASRPDYSSIIDSGRELWAAAHWVLTSYSTVYTSTLWGGFGAYRSSISINATGAQSPYAAIQNLTLISSAAGKPAFDMSGANSMTLTDCKVIGDSAAPPSVGYLLSRAYATATLTGVAPSAGSNRLINCIADGEFTALTHLNLSSDISRITNCSFYNRYRGRTMKTLVWLHAAEMETVEKYCGVGAIVSEYQMLPLAADGISIGTTIIHDYSGCEFRRPFAFSITPDSITVAANVATFNWISSSVLTAADVQEGDRIFVSNLNSACTIPAGSYQAKNITATSFELWNASGSAAWDASSGIGTYSTLRVTNDTGGTWAIGGYCNGIRVSRSYCLGYSPTLGHLDFDAGDIANVKLEMQCENGQQNAIRFERHATDARKLYNFEWETPQDLQRDTHWFISTGGDLLIDSPKARLGYTAPGTAAQDPRLFGGTLTGVKMQNVDFVVPDDLLIPSINTLFAAGDFTGRVHAADTGKTYVYPAGTYSPTFTSVANLASTPVQVSPFNYCVNGDWIEAFGHATVAVTAGGGVLTQGRVSLPIPSNLIGDGDLFGFILNGTGGSHSGHITADVANDAALFSFLAASTTASSHSIWIKYKWK